MAFDDENQKKNNRPENSFATKCPHDDDHNNAQYQRRRRKMKETAYHYQPVLFACD